MSGRDLSFALMRLHQSGAALIVALLIAALVAVIGVRVGNDFQLTLRRASNVIYSDQATLFLLSAETIGSQLLLADEEPEKDYQGEAWGTEYPPVPIGSGMLAPQPIVDLQGRFNLNSLKPANDNAQVAAGAQRSYTAPQKMFIRLLRTFDDVDMDLQTAEAIAANVIDWIDGNNVPFDAFEGAEDSYYTELELPYRTANRNMVSISELRLVKGVSSELYRVLAPHVTVLNIENSKINVNTASANVLQALGTTGADDLSPMSKSEVESYLRDFDPAVGLKKDAFLGLAPWSNQQSQPDSDLNDLIDVTSSFFAMSSYARLGELTMPMRSVMRRDLSTNTVEILSRSTGSL